MLNDDAYAALDRALAEADHALEHATIPATDGARQPVHTVYVPADRFTADLPARMGRGGVQPRSPELVPDADALAELLGVDAAIAARCCRGSATKLASEPIEDLRIDFEDGFGARPDADEDAAATARGGGAGRSSGEHPPFAGIRFKSLEPATRRRGVRTIDLFLSGLTGDGRRCRPGSC